MGDIYKNGIGYNSIKNPLQWAKDKADWYDPLVKKEDELLKNVNRNLLNSNALFFIID
ncbi:hypothetical protein GCM10022395_06200 [Snuella lapsa]|uniref:Uncharacterized protein n=1 Tax=Snuella lapsa TaxID=870481 RepID=A0ABP6WWV8_9FLAO